MVPGTVPGIGIPCPTSCSRYCRGHRLLSTLGAPGTGRITTTAPAVTWMVHRRRNTHGGRPAICTHASKYARKHARKQVCTHVANCLAVNPTPTPLPFPSPMHLGAPRSCELCFVVIPRCAGRPPKNNTFRLQVGGGRLRRLAVVVNGDCASGCASGCAPDLPTMVVTRTVYLRQAIFWGGHAYYMHL